MIAYATPRYDGPCQHLRWDSPNRAQSRQPAKSFIQRTSPVHGRVHGVGGRRSRGGRACSLGVATAALSSRRLRTGRAASVMHVLCTAAPCCALSATCRAEWRMPRVVARSAPRVALVRCARRVMLHVAPPRGRPSPHRYLICASYAHTACTCAGGSVAVCRQCARPPERVGAQSVTAAAAWTADLQCTWPCCG